LNFNLNKKPKCVEDHTMNIHVQFGFNHICSFWEEGIWNFPIRSNVNLHFVCGGHLGFPIGITNRILVKDIPMSIHLQFGFSQFISFREDLWNFSQSKHIIGPGSHVEYSTGTENRNFVEDHHRNIPAKFGSNWPSGFGEEAWNVKSLQTTDAKWWQ
jgi:hypothetical protein